MSRPNHNENGNVLVMLLTAVALTATLAVGWKLYENHRTASTRSTNGVSSQLSQGTNGTTNPTNQVSDPTAGWKTYCDSTVNDCFKYPSDWTLTESTTGGITSASVRNPGNTVLISYSSPFIKDSGVGTFYTVDIENLADNNINLKVVGGAFNANELPSYDLVNSSLLTTYPLTVGQSSDFQFVARFTNKHSTSSSQLTALPVGKAFHTVDDAKAWFATSDAKSALMILESFYYQ